MGYIKVKENKNRTNWSNKYTTDLFKAILRLKSVNECELFFRDLMTLSELDEMAGRWYAAKELAKEKSIREVAAMTNMSPATVTRVAHWLKYGTGGYGLIIDRVSEK